jgi:hypothetical protein
MTFAPVCLAQSCTCDYQTEEKAGCSVQGSVRVHAIARPHIVPDLSDTPTLMQAAIREKLIWTEESTEVSGSRRLDRYSDRGNTEWTRSSMIALQNSMHLQDSPPV